MELNYISLLSVVLSIVALLVAAYGFRLMPKWIESMQAGPLAAFDNRLDALARALKSDRRSLPSAPDESRLNALENRVTDLALLLDGHCSENTTQLAEIQALMANLVATSEVEPQEDEVPNPHGCTITTHVWRRRPSLKNDHEYVYYCVKGCNSSLRHRFE